MQIYILLEILLLWCARAALTNCILYATISQSYTYLLSTQRIVYSMQKWPNSCRFDIENYERISQWRANYTFSGRIAEFSMSFSQSIPMVRTYTRLLLLWILAFMNAMQISNWKQHWRVSFFETKFVFRMECHFEWWASERVNTTRFPLIK